MMAACRQLLLILVVCAPVFALAADAPSTHAATSSVQMQIWAGYGGYYRPSSFLPVHIRIANRGGGFVGTVRIDDAAQQFPTVLPYNRVTYTRTVVLPDGSVKDIVLYVPGVDLGPAVTVDLSAQGRLIERQTANVGQISTATEFIGVLSRTPAAYVQLKSFGGSLGGIQLRVVPLTAASMDPSPFALASLDAIIVENFDTTSLGQDQADALATWVHLGGVLVAIGGPTAPAVMSGLPPELRVAGIRSPIVLSGVPALSAFSRVVLPGGGIVAAIAQPANARVLLDDQSATVVGIGDRARGRPLVTGRDLGWGSVVYSAIDPTLAPIASWPGLQNFWILLTATVRAGGSTLATSFAGTGITNTQSSLNSEISSIEPPSISLFVVLLGVYVFALLPVNFVVLQRLRRRSLSWATLPGLAVILVATLIVGSYIVRGRELRASMVSVEYEAPDSSTDLGQMYVGLIAPTSGDYTLSLDSPSSLAAPLFYNVQNGAPPDIGNAASQVLIAEDSTQSTLPGISSWSSRSVSFALTIPRRPSLGSNLTLSRAGVIVGTIVNAGPTSIHGVLVQAPDGSIQSLGDVAPGAVRAVSLSMGLGGQSQGDISTQYGSLGAVVPRPPMTTQLGGAGLALVRAPVSLLLDGSAHLLAAGPAIPLNPGESTGERFQRISQAVLGSTNAAAFNNVLAIGWTSDQLEALRVNGAVPQRSDTNMIVQSLPLHLSAGTLALGAGTLPARLAGADQDLQTSAGDSGISLAPNSSAVFVAQLPEASSAGYRVPLTSLSIVASSPGAGIPLSSQSCAVWDWTAARWMPVDITSGQVRVSRPARYVDGAGVIRIRMSAQTAGLTIGDPNYGVAIGVTGRVGP